MEEESIGLSWHRSVELVLASHPAPGPNVPEEVFSIRNSEGRWVAEAPGRLTPVIRVENIAVFASDHEQAPSVKHNLSSAAEERALLTDRFAAQPCELKYERGLESFQTGGAQAAHFSCNRSMDVETRGDPALLLEDFKGFPALSLDPDETHQSEAREHPLVFLNACQAGGTGAELALITTGRRHLRISEFPCALHWCEAWST